MGLKPGVIRYVTCPRVVGKFSPISFSRTRAAFEMIVCRTCLRNTLRLLTSSKPSLRTKPLSHPSSKPPLRRYTAAAATEQPSGVPPISRPEETIEEKEWNSFSLRNKVEHWLKMKDPEAARRLIQRARVSQSVYAWNLVIKYYAHKGNYTDAYKTYQQVLIPCRLCLSWRISCFYPLYEGVASCTDCR